MYTYHSRISYFREIFPACFFFLLVFLLYRCPVLLLLLSILTTTHLQETSVVQERADVVHDLRPNLIIAICTTDHGHQMHMGGGTERAARQKNKIE